MASKNEDEKHDDAPAPGMKKRSKEAAPKTSEATSAAPKATSAAPEETPDRVVAPKAPTTAPTSPKAPKGPGGRRVVDPKEAEAKAQREKARKKKEKEAQRKRGGKKEKKEAPRPSAESAVGFTFAAEDASMDDFAAMLDASGADQIKRERYEVGDVVEGTVVSIGERFLFVDLGGPSEGVADRGQYVDKEGNLTVNVGETLEFYVVGFQDGIQLGKELGGDQAGLDALAIAHETGVPVSGKVTGTNKGGFEVSINGVDAFCPISQIELGFTEDPTVHVGQVYTFEVSEFREGGRTIVLSRQALLEKERAQRREETLEKLKIGEEIEGVVTRVAEFGAFVDIGGIEGLVHVSELSHIYFDDPNDVVKVGDHVKAQVMSVDEDPKRPGALRIGLSVKEAQEDPWMEVNEKFAIGERVEGTVVRIAPFGAFVEIAPGIDGLVHVSEMSWKKHVATPGDVVDVGESVVVEIQDIDVMRRRISLSMKGAEEDPWNGIEDRYLTGMEVTGTVANVEDFGAFVDIEEGVTALLPRGEMGLSSDTTPHRKYRQGQEVTARVLNVEPTRRRMALTLKEADEIEARPAMKSSGPAPKKGAPRTFRDEALDKPGSFGTLGDLLKAREQQKKK